MTRPWVFWTVVGVVFVAWLVFAGWYGQNVFLG